MKECKAYEDDKTKFCLYIHGYFIPWIEQQKAEGKIRKCKEYKNIIYLCLGERKIFGDKKDYEYEGEVDEND